MDLELDNNAQWLLQYLENYGDVYRYQVIRTCCAKVGNDLIPVGTTIRFDFNKITPSPEILWESKSMIITETRSSKSALDAIGGYTRLENVPYLDNEIIFSGLPQTLIWTGNVYNYPYWKTPMYDKTGTADLQTSWNIDLGADGHFAHEITTEISFHDKQASRTWEIPGLFRDFGIDVDRDFRRSQINILFPMLGRIESTSIAKSNLVVRGTALAGIGDEFNLNTTIHWSDGSVSQERRSLNVQPDVLSPVGSWRHEISLATKEKNALTAYFVLSLAKGFQVDATRHVVSVSPDAPIHVVSELDTAFVGGEIFSEWIKSEENVPKRIMQFEYFVATIFNAIGLPTVWLGPHDLSGMDLIAFDFSNGHIYSLECTTGAFRKKASLILQANRKLSELIPTKNLTNIMIASKTVSDADRKDLRESQVHVIDVDNLVRMIGLAKEGKRGSDILREIGITEFPAKW